jgi:EamA domain-containing membrane protein RarD
MAHWNTLTSAAKGLLTIALVIAVSVLTATLTSALVSFSKELATVVVVAGIVTAMSLAVFAFGEA